MVDSETIREKMQISEVGPIPHDWIVKTIEEIADVKSGKRLPLGKSLTKNVTKHPYIRVADMKPGGITLDNILYVPDEVFPAIKSYRIFIDDIFISVAGTLGVVGKIPFVLNGANLTENADRLTNITCDRDFLLYMLMSSLIQKRIESEKTLGAQPKLALTRIRKFQVPLPPTLEEQRKIAQSISDTDLLIDGLRSSVSKKRSIRIGMIQKMLKPKDDWLSLKLGEVATLKARIGWQGLTTSEYRNSGDFHLITGTEFKNGSIDWESCYYVDEIRYNQDKNIQVKKHDVLVTKDGTIGKVALIDFLPQKATLNSGVFVIRPINGAFHPDFFYYILLSDIFKRFLKQLSAGSTINHLYQKDFISFEFCVPLIEEQIKIAKILKDADKEISGLDMKLKKYQLIKQGMMQHLLMGKKRLKNYDIF